jgi:hypothetical protein
LFDEDDGQVTVQRDFTLTSGQTLTVPGLVVPPSK